MGWCLGCGQVEIPSGQFQACPACRPRIMAEALGVLNLLRSEPMGTRIYLTLADELWINPPVKDDRNPTLSKPWIVNDKGRGQPGAADPPPLLVLQPFRTLVLDFDCPGCIARITGQHDGHVEHNGHSPYGPTGTP